MLYYQRSFFRNTNVPVVYLGFGFGHRLLRQLSAVRNFTVFFKKVGELAYPLPKIGSGIQILIGSGNGIGIGIGIFHIGISSGTPTVTVSIPIGKQHRSYATPSPTHCCASAAPT
jgi:hypothetical protein